MTYTPAQRVAVANEAKRIGLANYPYQFAAAGPDAYDCSGVAVAAWRKVGLSLPHNSEALAALGMHPYTGANAAKLQPGDLVFYYGTTPPAVTHVAVFIELFEGGLHVVAQATDDVHGSEVIKMSKYATPTGYGFIGHT